MINYNPKDWSAFIFKMHKADTFRKLAPMMLYIGVYTFLIITILKKYLPTAYITYEKNLLVMHSLLGFVISMLLVFRTNTAYDRWWEGRKIWGSVINTARNCFILFNVNLEKKDAAINGNIVLNFCNELKTHLRKSNKNNSSTIHEPLQTINNLTIRLNVYLNTKKITEAQYIIISNEIKMFMEYTGACERIRNTPIPFIYNMFIKKFIFIYVMTLPFALTFNISYAAIPVCIIIFYVLASLETIAEEIEDPFGTDENDLPIDNFITAIKKSKTQLLGDTEN